MFTKNMNSLHEYIRKLRFYVVRNIHILPTFYTNSHNKRQSVVLYAYLDDVYLYYIVVDRE